MFRQVSDDRNLQRIIFRFKPEQPITHLRLSTVTYGQTCSTFLSVACLITLAEQNEIDFPLAAKALKENFYVDDGVMGADNITDALKLFKELNQVLSFGCFKLRKWSSNSQEFLNEISAHSNAQSTERFGNPDKIIKILGLNWNTLSDIISLPSEMNYNHSKITKRTILSEMSQIYDPFGLISPFVLKAKLIIQNLWCLKIGWDEEPPLSVQDAWREIRRDFSHIPEIQIPRFICINNKIFEIHGFSDASEKAYGYCLYSRTIDPVSNKISLQLMVSKTRIAPLKKLTIPKLELMAACLMATAISRLVEKIRVDNVFAWCDSKIVLAWIQKPAGQFKVFVANRIKTIQSASCINSWNYVPTDISSRGSSVLKLLNSDIWWHGPKFLVDSKNSLQSQDDYSCIDLPEQKTTSIIALTSQNNLFSLISNYSSLTKLLYVTAFLKRFAYNSRKSNTIKSKGVMTTEEIKLALLTLITISQKEHFSSDLKLIKLSETVRNKNLLSLSSFIDQDDILRVGGRIQLSDRPFDEKHPIILSAHCNLARLIVRDIHIKYLHTLPSVMFSTLRQKYWIIGGRKLVKSIYRNCLTCIKATAVPRPQIMANLPSYRVQSSRPFLNSGIDYGGPFIIRQSNCRGKVTTKAYLALFICLSTRAVHLEVVSDLTAECFIACLRRFISRRGVPSTILSDNGRNFVAASKYLSDMFSVLNTEHNTINKFMISHNIEWKFSPAYAPNFGGIWEAGIKSAKSYLKKSLSDITLTFEEISTMFSQIESILNSRPLVPMSDDPNDFEVLTPGHFLIGTALNQLPDIEEPFKIPLKSRWNLVQQRIKGFWKHWHKNYLQELQKRVKWTKQIPNLKENDIVLVKNYNYPF